MAVAKTGDDTLSGLDHPLAGLLRNFRSAGKRATTYGKDWLDEHAPGGSVLPSWRQLGAESGRMSCADPNLQQVPRATDYRKCFVARPGCVLVKADYGQIELKIAAVVAGEDRMIAAYQNGQDLHALTAARLLNKAVEEMTKQDRQLAKAVNFGLLFGMGWKSLLGYARANYGVALTEGHAQDYRDAFFRLYPKLRAWHDEVRGHVEHLFRRDPTATHVAQTRGGRRRALTATKGAAGKSYPNVTEALNFPVQGRGGRPEGRDRTPVGAAGGLPGCGAGVIFCHDEIVVEAPEATAEQAAEWLRKAMIDGMAPLINPVPVEVEVSTGLTWGSD